MVLVRDMWLTGFDAPSLHTMYVDKPMRGHGLIFNAPAPRREPGERSVRDAAKLTAPSVPEPHVIVGAVEAHGVYLAVLLAPKTASRLSKKCSNRFFRRILLHEPPPNGQVQHEPAQAADDIRRVRDAIVEVKKASAFTVAAPR